MARPDVTLGATPASAAVWRRVTRSDFAWLALWSAPLWSSVFSRVLKNRTPWFVDFSSVVCAAERSRAHLALYGVGATCPHLRMSAYVYPPWVAQSLVGPLRALGERGLLVVYGVIFMASFAFLLWSAFGRALADRAEATTIRDDRRARWTFLAFVAGSPLVVGNVAIVVQAAVVAAALFGGADSLALFTVIALASLIKPISLTYLAIPAFAAGRSTRRWLMIGATAGLTLGLAISNLPGVADWRRYVIGEAVDPNPGGGLLRWLGDAGVRDHLALALGYAGYAGLLFASGLIIARRGGLGREDRTWLGASFALLLLPRLVAYDLLILGPGLVAALAAARRVSPRAAHRLGTVLIVACAVNLLANLGGGAFRAGHSLSLILIAGGLVALAAALLRDGGERLRRRVTRPDRPVAD